VLAGALASGSVTALGGTAESAPERDALQQRSAALSRQEHQALLALYAAETDVARAREALARVRERLGAVEREQASAARRAGVLQRSLSASQARLGRALRMLYIEGETDPVEVVLGATSLEEALLGIESLSFTAEQNRRLAREAGSRAAELSTLRTELADRRRELAGVESRTAAGASALERVARERASYLASLRREGELTRSQIDALETRARAAEQASARISSPTSAAAEATAEPTATPAAAQGELAPGSPAGTRTLVVDAVAYHLPGVTASGIPVGVGVIAVDPTVIPLGTRVFVPGYGPAVAADVGTAIKGNIIDLWMPSTPQAMAWGRRAVTITIYG
jgi:3D (Asp-Asp-Asp) domain-containing protein